MNAINTPVALNSRRPSVISRESSQVAVLPEYPANTRSGRGPKSFSTPLGRVLPCPRGIVG